MNNPTSENTPQDHAQAAERQGLFLDEHDLEIAFNTAALLLGVRPQVQAKFYDFAGLKATASLRAGIVTAKASRGFRSATSEALVGLALSLLSKLYKIRIPPSAEGYARAYKEFSNRTSSSSLHDALRERRGRKGNISPQGSFFDLLASLNKVLTMYPEVLAGKQAPDITWSPGKSRRILAWYDSAFNKIVVNRKLDRPGMPDYVIDYLVYHELLHIKHRTTYHAESLRRCVHSREFKQDEKRFIMYDLAEKWLDGK